MIHRKEKASVLKAEEMDKLFGRKIKELEKQLKEERALRKKAEQELRESESRFNALLQSVDDIVFTLDTKQRHTGMYGKVFEKNPEARGRYLGKTVTEIMGHQEAEPHCEANRRALQGESLTYEWSAEMMGRKVHYSTLLSPIRDADGNITGVIGIGRDISSQKENEQALLDYNKKLALLNANKDKFFSIVSHDLRSPFYGLLGVSKELYERLDDYSRDEIRHFAFEIRNTLEKVYRWLDSLLQWSRLQSGRAAFRPAPISLKEAVDNIIELLSASIMHKRLKVLNETDEKLVVYADRNMLELILQNLLSNAIKFTYPDGEIIISAEEKNIEIIVSISDNGIGISGDILEKLFRTDIPYSTNGTLNEQGTGLGLVICREMVEMHGGRIWAESRPGKGAVFSFTIHKAMK